MSSLNIVSLNKNKFYLTTHHGLQKVCSYLILPTDYIAFDANARMLESVIKLNNAIVEEIDNAYSVDVYLEDEWGLASKARSLQIGISERLYMLESL